MSCYGFPFISYTESEEARIKANPVKPGLEEQTRLEQMADSTNMAVGTTPKDYEVGEIDLAFGLAPEHQERYHP